MAHNNKPNSYQPPLWNNPRKARIQFNDEQRLHWLQLSRSFNVGPILFRKLINRFSNAQKALEALSDIVAYDKSKKAVQLYPKHKAEKEMEDIIKAGARLVCLGELGYPPLLEHIDAPPPVLTLKGDVQLVHKPTISVVGTRRVSAAGIKFSTQLAKGMSDQGYVTVSGMARGIDSVVHKASLEGGTIAILAGGVDVVYPPENKNLYDEISANGLIVSELPIGTQAQHTHFPRRNRIIAGISPGTLVVEAALRSGSLITAQYALDFNREIFAVPGFPLDPRSAGVNKLIKEGAHPVTEISDILTILNPLMHNQEHYFDYSLYDYYHDDNVEPIEYNATPVPHNTLYKETAAQFVDDHAMLKQANEEKNNHQEIHEHLAENTAMTIIGNLLTVTPIDIDSLVHVSHLPIATVQSTLVELELLGIAKACDGNRFCKIINE